MSDTPIHDAAYADMALIDARAAMFAARIPATGGAFVAACEGEA